MTFQWLACIMRVLTDYCIALSGIGLTGQTGLTGVTGATGLSGMLFSFHLTSSPFSDMGTCTRVKALIYTVKSCICHYDLAITI